MDEIVTMKISKEIQDLLEIAKPGDMIEFIRGIYSHWGIYIGDEHIIHRWGDNDGIGHAIGLRGNVTTIFGVQFDKAKIEKSQILAVLKYGGKIRINNYLDSKFKPLPVEIILDKANSALGQQGYNVIYDNCEHFTTDCRYGQSNSRQVQVVVAGSLATGIFMTLVAAAGAYFLRNFLRKKEEEEEEEKEIKIKMSN